jgi:hypothetical protein
MLQSAWRKTTREWIIGPRTGLSVMSPQDPQAAALLAHIVSQIEQNVSFLASQNHLSQSDAATILTKLPNDNNNAHATNELANGVSNINLSVARAVPPPPRPRTAPEEHDSSLPRARAIWPYGGEVRHVFVPSRHIYDFVSRIRMT